MGPKQRSDWAEFLTAPPPPRRALDRPQSMHVAASVVGDKMRGVWLEYDNQVVGGWLPALFCLQGSACLILCV